MRQWRQSSDEPDQLATRKDTFSEHAVQLSTRCAFQGYVKKDDKEAGFLQALLEGKENERSYSEAEIRRERE